MANTGKIAMVPSSHDITPYNIMAVISLIRSLILKGDTVLIVTKPRMKCINLLIDALSEFKDKVIFRLTLTTMNDDVRAFWEPGATTFEERFECLKLLYTEGFTTSVSSEPFLSDDIIELFYLCKQYVTEHHWIGKLNFNFKYRHWSNSDLAEAAKVKAIQTDERILNLYKTLRHEQSVQWKDSIKKVLVKHNITV